MDFIQNDNENSLSKINFYLKIIKLKISKNCLLYSSSELSSFNFYLYLIKHLIVLKLMKKIFYIRKLKLVVRSGKSYSNLCNS